MTDKPNSVRVEPPGPADSRPEDRLGRDTEPSTTPPLLDDARSERGELVNRRATPHQATSYMAFSGSPPSDDDPLLAFEPVPHVAPRRNSITPDRQRAFIAALAATGIVTQAARAIGVSMEAIYKLRQRPGAEGFRAAWEEALDRGVARLEDCALQRAIEGEERMVVSAGKLVGTERRHNEALVMFFLRQRRAARYSADAVPRSSLVPGNPVYEQIRREVLEAEYGDEEQVIAEIDEFIETMRRNRLANAALVEQAAAGTSKEDGE